ncbi:DUF1684 domain-containing protein [Cellulophaga baltica]|uniref:DUF1684 domain-containing protein n=1 Tax=Cellulophaga TaxID=104264 RepID=UPI001C072C43|nr:MULTISPECIES: DUF1684 domain-containing protein [Cellulophaga]MBU2996893.1 DUF1684 domain-containing protein [Cellulophaga baltica]MDO6768291.1 DUF1684 domain-containing protein [Cellulophaga sp. 1_MG-2023]
MRLLLIVLTVFIVGCNGKKKYHDIVENKITQDTPNAIADILEFQKELNEEYKDPETSPLYDKDRVNFESLDFFAPDTTYRVMARFERTPDALPFFMPTTTNRKSKEVVFGILYFKLLGDDYQLEVYQNSQLKLRSGFKDYLFLPFLDETNGKETYSGGRYIDLRIPDGDSILLDFNKAYNPYCAYNKKYSCPVVPKVNTLNVSIKAGVKAFKK